MSLAGRIRFRGALADVFRPVKSDGAGGIVNVAWPTVPTLANVRALPASASEELSQSIFGRDTAVDLRVLTSARLTIALDDGVVMRSGDYKGQRFRVSGIAPQASRRASSHKEIALERTTEVFG